MPAVSKRPPPPVLRTRGALKREYEATIPPGEEEAAFNDASAALEAIRAKLRTLRARRVDLARRTAEHVRKLADWKGKVPRPAGSAVPPLAQGDIDGVVMPCKSVAVLGPPTRAVRGAGRAALHFRAGYARALDGVDRFSKVWVLVRVGEDVDTSGWTGIAARSWNSKCLRMVLLDVVERRGSSAVDKDILIVSDGREVVSEDSEDDEDGVVERWGLDCLHGSRVIDIKPYLSYCESLPSD